MKSPKLYVRDSGRVHALLGIADQEALLGHPVAGGSWEGMVVESVLTCAPHGTDASFYRTSAGAEIDRVLTLPGGRPAWAIAIKRGLAPKLQRGFHHGCDDLHATPRRVVSGGSEAIPMGDGIQALPPSDLCARLIALR